MKILMRRLKRSRLIRISAVCKCMSEFTWCPKWPDLPYISVISKESYSAIRHTFWIQRIPIFIRRKLEAKRVHVMELLLYMGFRAWVDLERAQSIRTPPPPKNHKNIGFPSKTGPDPLKNHNATKKHSMLGHHRPVSETHSGIWILSSIKKKKKRRKNTVKDPRM